MFIVLALAATLAALPPHQQTEKPVDPSSARISIAGCLRGKNLLSIEPREGEPVTSSVPAGRTFRLNGPKDVMKELGKHDKSAVAVTGLVRRAAVDPSLQGMPIGAGGRVRIGGGPPVSSDPTRTPGRDPLANVSVMDVESFRPIDAVCPKK
jgi:hypothetical protein